MTEIFSTKQVIVIRKDLRMGLGKLISQACHASLEASEEAKTKNFTLWKRWRKEGAKKVIVKVNSLTELLDLNAEAKKITYPYVINYR